MNAFKKDLTGILFEDTELNRAMEQVVLNIDEVFINLLAQKEYSARSSTWYVFLSMIAMHLDYKIKESCINDKFAEYYTEKKNKQLKKR